MARRGWWTISGALLVVGCGGIVERSSGGAGDGTPTTPAEQPGEDSAPGIDPRADTELGECVLGDRETFTKPCAWVAEDRCYDTRQMACNCVCPRDRDSQCTSGFEGGPDGHVWVACR